MLAHLVFALHVCAFWLLFICASLMLTNLALRRMRVFPSADAVTRGGLVLSLVVMTAYLFRAARVVFSREPAWMTLAKAAVLGLALEVSLQAYRFALFFITFWST